MRHIWLVFINIIGHLLLVHSNKQKVTIPDGTLEGLVLKDYNGGKFYSFKGIPFAKPPIGELRFKEAVKNDPWKGVLDATKEVPICVQPNPMETEAIGTEDCLYLNVFTNSLDKNILKPVMIYVHGGKFVIGNGGEFGAEFLMPEDIVLVTVNYRLGVFGFINMVNSDNINDENEMVANNGFRDQVMAMKWVQNNIKYFGGDPNMVTLAGESAGGMAVHGHVLSPLSKGFFQRAIPMSGTSIMVMVPTINNTAIGIAKYLGIDTSDHDAMIHELKHSTTADLYKAQKDLKWFEIQLDSPTLTALVIEKPGVNSFMPDYPLHLIKSGKYSKVPMLMGTTNKEGLLIHSMTQENVKDLHMHIPFFFQYREEVHDKVKAFYGINSTSDQPNITLYTDIWFRFNAFRTAVEHSKIKDNGDIYFYEFAGDTELNYLKPMLPTISNYSGACHADELGYLFKCSHLPEAKANSVEEKVMKLMVKIWTNFVKTGKPYDNWEPFQPYASHVAKITNDGLKFGVMEDSALKFWADIYEHHGNGKY